MTNRPSRAGAGIMVAAMTISGVTGGLLSRFIPSSTPEPVVQTIYVNKVRTLQPLPPRVITERRITKEVVKYVQPSVYQAFQYCFNKFDNARYDKQISGMQECRTTASQIGVK